MKYGIELEYFVSKDSKIVPAYMATTNLDGNPFLGEIKTKPFDSLTDCLFELDKLIFLEQEALKAKGFKMELISEHQFSKDELVAFRKDPLALSRKEIEVLEELSIYPGGKLGKLLKTGQIKASLQINLSQHKLFSYTQYTKITVEDKYRYEQSIANKEYACVFNYVSIIQKLDKAFAADITKTNRVAGVYAIKTGEFGERIEYRSLPNTINYKALIGLI